MESKQSIELNCEFDEMKAKHCNFNTKGEFILFCTIKNIKKDDNKTNKTDDNKTGKTKKQDLNIVCIYSIQTEVKCQKVYMIPKEAEVISISKHDKIWLRFNDYIHEWNFHTGDITIISANAEKIIINFQEYYC